MHDAFRQHVARLAVRLGLVDEAKVTACASRASGSLSRALVEEGLLDHPGQERIYATLRAALLRTDPRALERRADQTVARLAVEKGFVDKDTLLAHDAARQAVPLAERPPLAEALVKAGAISPAQLTRLEELHHDLYRACSVCGEVAPRAGQRHDPDCARCGWRRDDAPDKSTVAGDAVEHVPDLTDPFLGRELGGCKVLRKLGQGGMGAVYVGRHLTLEHDVAIKILPFAMAADHTSRERFLREARAAARLSHPNVVRVLDVASEGGTYFMIQELVVGESVQARLDREGKLDVPLALRLAQDAGAALGAAHAAGIIHRDVKPDNLLLTKDDQLKLADFGLARDEAGASSLSATGMMLGTPAYMSPEQAEGNKVDVRADVYSLGVTLYALLTGSSPFQRPQMMTTLMAVLLEPLPPLGKGFPAGLDAVLAKMAAKKPEGRYSTMEEALVAIGRLRDGGAAVGAPGTAPASRRMPEAPARRVSSRRAAVTRPAARVPWGPVAGVGAVVLALIVWIAGPASNGPVVPADRPPTKEPIPEVRPTPKDPPPPAYEALLAAASKSIAAHVQAGRYDDARTVLDGLRAAPPTGAPQARVDAIVAAERAALVLAARAAYAKAGRAIIDGVVTASQLEGGKKDLERLPRWGLDELEDDLASLIQDLVAKAKTFEVVVRDDDGDRALTEAHALLKRREIEPALAALRALRAEPRFAAALERAANDIRLVELAAVEAVEGAWLAAAQVDAVLPVAEFPRWNATVQRVDGEGVALVFRVKHGSGDAWQDVRRIVPIAEFSPANRAAWAARALPTAQRAAVGTYKGYAIDPADEDGEPPPGFTIQGKNSQGFMEVRHATGVVLVWVSAGRYTRGRTETVEALKAAFPDVPAGWFADEEPEARAHLDGYWIGKHEVTNGQYAAFLQVNPEWCPGGALAKEHGGPEYLADWTGAEPPAHRRDHPVVHVSYHAAAAYAAWLGLDLPDQAQAEKAARGAYGLVYPWGDAFDAPNLAATASLAAGEVLGTVAAWHARFYLDWKRGARAVETRPAGAVARDVSPYGVSDLAGNVREWRRAEGAVYVHGGGGWDGGTWEARASSRRVASGPLETHPSLGFRVASGRRR